MCVCGNVCGDAMSQATERGEHSVLQLPLNILLKQAGVQVRMPYNT